MDGITVRLEADMRYYGQRYEVTVPLSQDQLSAAHIGEIEEAFFRAYRDYYGREIRDVPVETVSWRLNVSGPAPELDIEWPGRTSAQAKPVAKAERHATFPGTDEPALCQVFERGDLPVGITIDGPCIIEDHESTTVVPAGATLSVDDDRMLVLDISGVL